MKLLASIRKFLGRRGLLIARQPAQASSGPAYEHITITEGAGTHTAFAGWTSYGKGHVPPGGHKATTTVEYEEAKPMRDEAGVLERDQQHRDLLPGEPLEIGDEYLVNGVWTTLTEAEYAEWVSFASHYDPDEMAPFRRPLLKDQRLAARSASLFEAEADKTNRMVLEYLLKRP